MFFGNEIKAIAFDSGDTLIRDYDRVGNMYLRNTIAFVENAGEVLRKPDLLFSGEVLWPLGDFLSVESLMIGKCYDKSIIRDKKALIRTILHKAKYPNCQFSFADVVIHLLKGILNFVK